MCVCVCVCAQMRGRKHEVKRVPIPLKLTYNVSKSSVSASDSPPVELSIWNTPLPPSRLYKMSPNSSSSNALTLPNIVLRERDSSTVKPVERVKHKLHRRRNICEYTMQVHLTDSHKHNIKSVQVSYYKLTISWLFKYR